MRHLALSSRLGLGILLVLMLLGSTAPAMMSAPGSPAAAATPDEAQYSLAVAQTGVGGPEISTAPRSVQAPLGANSIVVILVQFTDMTHTFSQAQVAQVAIGDLSSYYEEASYNQTHVTGATTSWLSLGHNRQYYVSGTSSPSDPSFDLVWDALTVADSSVNFAAYDGVTIVHAGQGQELSGDWRDYWSSEWWGFTFPTNDGVSIHRASVSPEVGLPGSLAYVGVIAHEFGHDLGLPDLYDTSYSGADYVGHWCLMGAGSWNGPNRVGESPAHMMGWCKLQLGYVNGTQVLQVNSSGVTVVVDPLESPTSGVQLIKIPIDSDHYYLIEVRQKIGYDQWLRGKGVLLSYVDETLPSGGGIVKVVDSHPATVSKDDGAFDVGAGAVDSYMSAPGQFSMFIENAIGNSYNITILRAWMEFLSPQDGSAVLTSSFPITWNGSAASGIDHFELYFDGALVYNGSAFTHSLTSVAAGLHNATLVMVLAGSDRRLTAQSHFVVDLVPPTIHQVFNIPAAPGFGDPIYVVVNATDDTWIVNATVFFRRSGDPTWYQISMVQYSGVEWRALLGTFLPGVTVTYYVTVYDAGGRAQTDDNSGTYYSFTISGLGLIIWLIIGAAVGLAIVFLICRSVQKHRRGSSAPEHVWAPPTSSSPEQTAGKQPPADYAEPAAHSSFCFSCGAPLTPGATYCPYCGRPVRE
jgi:M6 family metalloprotease-like protein